MKNKSVSVVMLLILLLTVTPMALRFESAHANPAYGPSLVVKDTMNRINATLGIKSGSKMAIKGFIKNVGSKALNNLLTSAFFKEGTPGVQPLDMSFEWSLDCSTWYAIDPSEVKSADASSGYQVELIIGPPGGETLNPGDNRTVCIRATFIQDLTKVSSGYSIAVWSFNDTNANRHWDAGETIYSESPPSYDTPIKIDLAIVHTAEIEGTGKFYYSIQDAVNAASSTIILYPGTYAPFTVSGKTSLTIVANGAVVVKGSQSVVTHYANRDAVIFVTGSTGITLDGLDIEGLGLGTTNAKSYAIIYESSSGIIKGCTVSPNTIGDMNGVAIGVWDYSNLVIDPCIIKKFGRIGVFFFNGCTGGVYNSTIEGQVYSDENYVVYGIEIEPWDYPCNIEIVGNIIYNCDNTYYPSPTWSSAGIVIDGWVASYDLPHSTVTMICNNIYHNYYGVEVVANPYSWAHYNNIYNNRIYGAIEDPNFANINITFDARYNWWGDATGPYNPTLNPSGLGNPVSDNVNFSPWLLKVKVLPFVHDVAVSDVTATPGMVKIGGIVSISVTVNNLGNCYENDTLTVTYCGTIKTETIKDWTPGTTKTFTYAWDTTGQSKCLHLVSALLNAVTGETYLFNNYRDTNVALVTNIPLPTTLKVMPVPATGVVGGPLKINITINNLDQYWDLVGFSFKLHFNTTLLKATGVSLGAFANYFNLTYAVDGEINNVKGYVSVGYIWNPATKRTSPFGSGTLVTITFLVNTVGTGSFDLTDVKLSAFGNESKWCVPYTISINYATVGGTLKTKLPMLGDVNRDGTVDIYDVTTICMAYDSTPTSPNWNPNADLAPPYGLIDIYDVCTVLINYGKIDP
jgi:hypothetical protein